MEPDEKRPLNFNPTPEQIRAFLEKEKQKITNEDFRWYENPGDLVPFEQVIQELEEFVEREGLQGTDE